MSEKSQPLKACVVIDLPPILEAFLRFATKTPVDQNEIIVTRKNDFGRLINGFLSKSAIKPELDIAKNPVYVIVPRTPHNWFSIETMYVYITKEDQEQIVDRLEVYFNKWLECFFSDGYAMNFSQFDIIESVLDILNVRSNSTNFDQIKKRDYRKTKSDIRKRSIEILKLRLSVV